MTAQDTTQDVGQILDLVERLPNRARELVVHHFASVDELRAATVEDLCALDGIGAATARKIAHAAGHNDDPAEVGSFRHLDKRKNIPTDEHAHLIDSTGDGEPDTMLYPRDPDLDPQLVWRGKDAADSEPLAVPVVPIYIQEKVDPRVIIENLRDTAANQTEEPEMSLFDDFDGIDDPLAAIEHYEHDANWSNRLILGDALLAMTSLAEKEHLKGKVQTIYIDPPYGIKFQSNWQVSTRNRSVSDGKDISAQPEQIRAFRDTWKNGINSYLSYLRDRLVAARTLLTESGSVFVQISDDNVHVVRSLLDEVFGPQNFVSTITFQKTTGARTQRIATVADYILWYARDNEQVKVRRLFKPQLLGGEGVSGYTQAMDSKGNRRPLTKREKAGLEALPAGERAVHVDNLTSQSPGSRFPVEVDGTTYNLSKGYWKTDQEGMERLIAARRVAVTSTGTLGYIRCLDDFNFTALTNLWTDTVGQNQFGGAKRYVVQTALTAIERCILMSSDPGDLVLDPTCGSGSTAVVAEKWGRRWIAIDTSRVALALTRQRLMSVTYPYFVLADSASGAVAESRESGHEVARPAQGWNEDIRRGFVYRRAPHIMLSTIANCDELRPGMSVEEVDAALRRYADLETFVDQPHQDDSIVRVTGRFTVESLSPHRTISPNTGTTGEQADVDFVELVLDNLTTAGVQNGYRNERLNLSWLEPHAGGAVHAVGGFTDADGDNKTVAVTVGPETGTVGREIIAEAAKEAARELRADLLLVCAYAFDAGAGEQATSESSNDHVFTADGQRQVGRLKVLNVRVNHDLMMGEDLKNTGTGNLFTVFGEPDIKINELEDDTITVTLNGLDVYDPNKGTIRSTDPDDIACWFIDTNYNGDSFFVRHAYFTGGAKDPFEALRKAVKAEINDEAWSALFQTTSIPFERPTTGKIAVKAINHYGDEALSTFSV